MVRMVRLEGEPKRGKKMSHIDNMFVERTKESNKNSAINSKENTQKKKAS